MKKKLFLIFGPVILAFLMFISLMALPANDSPKVLRNASQSLTMSIISGEHIKNKAMEEKEYVPFLGSSELNRFDPFHPSVLAVKYDRPYRPFLLGSAGTQSLKQYMILSSMDGQLKHKRAVFIISPQWFTKDGMEQQYFSHWYSGVQMYHWLYQVSQKKRYSEEDRRFASRLQHFDMIKNNIRLQRYTKQIANNQSLTQQQKETIARSYKNLMYEDRLFGRLGVTGINDLRIDKYANQLPTRYNYNCLDKEAYRIGKENTTNNSLQIENSFYRLRLSGVMKGLKGKDKTTSFLQSPEYADFQLVLNEFARTKTDVLFIIPPVNEHWAKYTGLSTTMMNQFAAKITKQLKSQGFNNVLNLTDNKESYFMTDTIHIGWRGWLYCDKAIRPFLESNYQQPNYHLDDYYYSKQWQQWQPNQ